MTFDKRQTNIAKGVAVLLLLWHHLFYNDPKNYGKFISILKIDNVPIECVIAGSCKGVWLFSYCLVVMDCIEVIKIFVMKQ